ncbi:MAG: putative quinol monooxygenase, partial [Pseudomonadota bacterium]
MFVVAVTFEVEPDAVDRFRRAVVVNAKSSVAEEPGCHVFDVSEDPDFPSRFFLYEVYEDNAA